MVYLIFDRCNSEPMRIAFLSLTVFLFSFYIFTNDISPCDCGDEKVEYCMLDETTNFTGFCTSEGLRVFGKSFYDNGNTFEGTYYKGSDSVGTFIWQDGSTFEGEFNVSNAGYDIPNTIDIDQFLSIGQFGQNTITARGFFEISDEYGITLVGFGTKYNTDPEGEFTYKAGVYKDDVRIAESLTTKENNSTSYEAWQDYSEELENSNVFIVLNGQKKVYTLDSEGRSIKDKQVEGWSEENQLKKNRIELAIEINKERLDKNFNVLNARLIETKRLINRESKSDSKIRIKPLSSDLVSSIQELLTILGYETGEIDGVLGRLTISGIKAFQKASKIEMDGKPSDNLIILLQEGVRIQNNKIALFPEDTLRNLPIASTGTGFYINQNSLVTNYHVIQKCNYISIEEGERLIIKAQDQVNDVAILESKTQSNSFLSLSNNPALGESIYAAGYPYNDVLKSFNFTSGNVSSLLGTGSNISHFQLTAPVQPGNSGGPILNSKGGVIGITVSGFGVEFSKAKNTIPQNIAFGIKIGVIKDILSEKGIEYTAGDEYWFDGSQKEIASLSKDASVVINCHAKI